MPDNFLSSSPRKVNILGHRTRQHEIIAANRKGVIPSPVGQGTYHDFIVLGSVEGNFEIQNVVGAQIE